jgi:hypothetical protein
MTVTGPEYGTDGDGSGESEGASSVMGLVDKGVEGRGSRVEG